MAAIDYGVLVIRNGEVINEDLFPDVHIGDYILYFYKNVLTIFYKGSKTQIQNYYFGWDGKVSYHLDTVVGKMNVRLLTKNSFNRWVTKVSDYTIIFGYGIDPDKHRGYQKHIMNDCGFDKREKRIISNYLWEKENANK